MSSPAGEKFIQCVNSGQREPAIDALNSLAMFEMLPLLGQLSSAIRSSIVNDAQRILSARGWNGASDRIRFAAEVVELRSMPSKRPDGFPPGQLSDVVRYLSALPNRGGLKTPDFFKPSGSSTTGSVFTKDHTLFRQEVGLGGTARVAVRQPGVSEVRMSNPDICNLIIYKNDNSWGIDVVGVKPGDGNLEARFDNSVVTSIQVHVSGAPDKTTPSVDDFSQVIYDFKYRSEKGDPSKWLRVIYWDATALEIHLDRIGDAPAREQQRQLLTLGEGGRLWPPALTRASTPRLWVAKQQALAAIEEYLLDMILAGFPGVFFVITINPFVAPENPMRSGSRQRVSRSGGAGAKTLVKPVNEEISVGGGTENPNVSNLNPIKPGSGGPVRGIPNHVLGSMEEMDQLFVAGSAKRLTSSRLRFNDVDWSRGTKAAAKVVAPGGRVAMNVWTQFESETATLEKAFTEAGFKEVKVVRVGLDGSSTMVFAVR